MASFMRNAAAGMGCAAPPGGVQLSSTPPLGPARPRGRSPAHGSHACWYRTLGVSGRDGAMAQACYRLPVFEHDGPTAEPGAGPGAVQAKTTMTGDGRKGGPCQNV